MALPGGGLLRVVVSSSAALVSGTRQRVRQFEGRTHIAVRGLSEGELPGPKAEKLAEDVQRRLADVPGVAWAVVNTVLGHAVVATEDTCDPDEIVSVLIEAVEAAEDAHGVEHPLPDHPLSGDTLRRAAWAVAVHMAAAPLAAASELTRRAPVPTWVASLFPIIDSQPRLRSLVERAVGTHNAKMLMAGLTALGQAGSGGLLGTAVDAVRHTLRVMEADAERSAWAAAEPHLTGSAAAAAHGVAPVPPSRPAPLKRGPVERYADQAPLVAAASFAGALLVTGQPGKAVGGALAAVPKAPLLAREGFACAFGRGLARRGVLVPGPDALRALDRVGTVLLDTDALATGSHLLADLIALDEDAPAGDLAATAHRLFDGSAPERAARDGDWELGPVECLSLHGRTGSRARQRLEHNGARLVLGLAHGHRLLAVVSVVPELHDAAAAFVPAAHASGLTLVVAGAHTGDPAVREADAVRDAGERLTHSVRDLQRDGDGVLLISRNRHALRAADVGVGLTGPKGAPPWGADVYVKDGDLAAALLLVRACRGARESAHRGVRLAQAAAAVGATAALAGRSTRPEERGVTAFSAAAALGTVVGVWSAARLLRHPRPSTATRHPWHAMAPSTVLDRTGSRAEGLTGAEVHRRGTGTGEQARTSSLGRAYLTEMANPLTPVLGAGAAMSASVGAVLDAVVIVAVTALSGFFGGFQRHRTDRAVARLRRESAVMAKVVRDGAETTVPAQALVVGDVVALSAGDVVPSDARLLEAHHLEVDESALTGESFPVAKDVAPVLASDLAERRSMVYDGTTIAAGRCRAVVVATGTATEASRAATAGRGAAPAVGVERRLARITRSTLPVALGSAAAVMAAGTLRGRAVRDTVGAGVGLAVASVPEGLPFLVSAAQLASARRLSVRGALVRDPRTIEAAGRTDVLCFDKTGTLTHGHISLVAVAADGESRPLESLGDEQRTVLAAALRATPRPHGDAGLEHATDGAVTTGAEEAGVRRTTQAPEWQRLSSLPFEPSRGFHATLGRTEGHTVLSVKGAPEEVVERCATLDGRPLDEEGRADVLATGEKLAAEGHRILAVAELRDATGDKLTDDAVRDLDFLGFLAFADRVRGAAADAVRQLADAGVQIVMITGDHPSTAGTTAAELGVLDGRRVVTGAELDDLDDSALDALLPDVGVVARGTPVHKVRVVQAFQRLGRTVAMTGDGANDAPAIRLADIGIAFGTRATPAARAAADLVVTDDRLETVLAALVEGRAMWASVRQALAILVGGNLGEIAFTLLGAATTGSSPLTARQLLLVNLFTDLAPAIAVALRPPNPETAERLLHEGPEVSLGTALTEETVCRAVATALGATAGWLAARFTGRAARARTVALVALVTTQLGQTLLAGGRSWEIVGSSLGSLAALAAVVQTPVLSQFFGCTPLGPMAWTIALSAAVGATVASPFLPALVGRARAVVAHRGPVAATS